MPGNRSHIQTTAESFVQPKEVTQSVAATKSAVPHKCLMRIPELQFGDE